MASISRIAYAYVIQWLGSRLLLIQSTECGMLSTLSLTGFPLSILGEHTSIDY